MTPSAEDDSAPIAAAPEVADADFEVEPRGDSAGTSPRSVPAKSAGSAFFGAGGAHPSKPWAPPPPEKGDDGRPTAGSHCPWALPPWPPPLF